MLITATINQEVPLNSDNVRNIALIAELPHPQMGSITKTRCTKIMCKGVGLRDMAKASTRICKIPSWPI